MYKKQQMSTTSISVNNTYKSETIEEKVRRIVSNKEPIKDGAPLIYTERKDGVLPSYNIRTDRFEVAVDAMEGIYKANIAKREQRAKVVDMGGNEVKDKGEGQGKDAGGESIQGTDK